MAKQYSPQAQALLDKMRPLGERLRVLHNEREVAQLRGDFDMFKSADREYKDIYPEFSKLQNQYVKLRKKEEGIGWKTTNQSKGSSNAA